MEIAGYEFRGPFTNLTNVPLDAAGVYVVVDLVDGEPRCCLDVGSARQLGDRLSGNERESCWEDNAVGEIAYCYRIAAGSWERDLEADPLGSTPEDSDSKRAGITSELKWKLEFPCGRDPWEDIERLWALYQAYEAEFGERNALDP